MNDKLLDEAGLTLDDVRNAPNTCVMKECLIVKGEQCKENLEKNIKYIFSVDLREVQGSHFSGCISLKMVSLQSAVSIGNSGFAQCTRLSSVSMPNLQIAGDMAFSQCSQLEKLKFPSLVKLGSQVFFECFSLKELDAEQLLSVGKRTFDRCKKMSICNCPQLQEAGEGAFANCQLLDKLVSPLIKANSFDCNCRNCPKCKGFLDKSPVVKRQPFLMYDVSEQQFLNDINLSLQQVEKVKDCDVINGCLILKKKEYHYAAQGGRVDFSFVFAPLLKVCDAEQFVDCSNLKQIFCPKLKKIENRAFKSCS